VKPIVFSTETTILVVDDDKSTRLMFARFLQAEGYQILEAESGDHALEILRAKSIDLIISDIEMANGNGFELLRKLRKVFPSPPPLIFASSKGGLNETDLEAMGAVRFLPKPVCQKELVNAIEDILASKVV